MKYNKEHIKDLINRLQQSEKGDTLYEKFEDGHIEKLCITTPWDISWVSDPKELNGMEIYTGEGRADYADGGREAYYSRIKELNENGKAYRTEPVYIYEHGMYALHRVATGDRWDTTDAMAIYISADDKPYTDKDIEEILDEVERYWNGDYYEIEIFTQDKLGDWYSKDTYVGASPNIWNEEYKAPQCIVDLAAQVEWLGRYETVKTKEEMLAED